VIEFSVVEWPKLRWTTDHLVQMRRLVSKHRIQLQILEFRTLVKPPTLLTRFDYNIRLGSERSGEPDGGV
jgi:hypothetical protein